MTEERICIQQEAEAAEAALLAGRYCETCGRYFERVHPYHWKVCRCVWERIKASVPMYGIQFEVVDERGITDDNGGRR